MCETAQSGTKRLTLRGKLTTTKVVRDTLTCTGIAGDTSKLEHVFNLLKVSGIACVFFVSRRGRISHQTSARQMLHFEKTK